jgi:putative ABC transport system ATP-binding protein
LIENMNLIAAKDLSKTYATDSVEVRAVQGVSFEIKAGAFLCFVGPSGSGKTTLLNLIGCLDKPSSGSLEVAGVNVSRLDRSAAAAFRGKNIGFVFQSFNLMPVLTAFENIEYPLVMVQNKAAGERRARVLELLEAVSMSDQKNKFPEQLSGGQKQRVAIARALVTQPKLVLADEPTAALDTERGKAVMDLLRRLRRSKRAAVIVVTHDERMIAGFDRVYDMIDGRITAHRVNERS